MSVINSIQNIANTTRVSGSGSAPSGLKPYASVDVTSRTDLLRARSSLLRLYRSLESLAEIANVDTRTISTFAEALSAPGLSLDLTETAANLSSTEEINASPTSFTPFGPAWSGATSALLTIGGEYDGSNGNGDLQFESRRSGTHGVDNLRIRVYDPQGFQIQNLNIRASDPIDTQYALGNGLYLTLGGGDLVNRDTASIQVFDNVGAVVDPDLPLGGIRNSNPNLQFGLPSVVDGSFDVNGINIGVSTTDTINDVIDRINLSAAGVTASFNASTEQLDFLQDTTGAMPTIDLQNDTSNFLQATKLDSATVVPGIDPEDRQSLDSVAEFAGVQSGNILVNNTQIAVDTANDSLTTMIDKINASGAGVTASFDFGTQKVLIQPDDPAAGLDIDSNGTGFFAALNLVEGQLGTENAVRGISKRRSYEIADAFNRVFEELNYLFRDGSFLGKASATGAFRAPLEGGIRGVLGESFSEPLFGLNFSESEDARARGDFATIDRRDFTGSLQRRGDSVLGLLESSRERAGLIENMLTGAKLALRSVGNQLGLSGSFVDTYA